MYEPIFTGALGASGAQDRQEGLVVSLIEITDRGMIDLRGSAGDKSFMTAVAGVLDLGLPVTPRTSETRHGVTVLWLSVDQWLITCPRDQAPDLHDKLVRAIEARHAFAVDLSDARAIIRLSGDGAREVIMKSAAVDLLVPEFDAGCVRRMNFAGIAAMIHIMATGPDVIDLYVFRSYANHVWRRLEVTAANEARIKLFGEQVVSVV